MDVHPPHQPIHTWKDFLIHLVAIMIGLLLALGLEGLVEMVHHHNLVNEAKADLRSEITANHANAQANLTELRADEERIAADGKTLLFLRAGAKLKTASLDYTLKWNALGNSAWKTAGSSGALAYLDFESERNLAHVYYIQDDLLAPSLARLLRDHSLAPAPVITFANDPEKASKESLDLSLQRSADLMADLKTMEDFLKSLDQEYVKELSKL